MPPHYNGEWILGCPVGSHLIPDGCLIDCLSIFSIYTLTHSRLQSGLVFGFSLVAFIASITTLATIWSTDS